MSAIQSAEQAAMYMYLNIDSEEGKEQLASVGRPKISRALHGHHILYYSEGVEMIVHSSRDHPLPWHSAREPFLYVGSVSLLAPASMASVDPEFQPYEGKLWGTSTFDSTYEQVLAEHGPAGNPDGMLASILHYPVAERWAFQFSFDRDLKQLKNFHVVPPSSLVHRWLNPE